MIRILKSVNQDELQFFNNNARQVKLIEHATRTFIGLIGSKFVKGAIARVTTGPTINIKDESLV